MKCSICNGHADDIVCVACLSDITAMIGKKRARLINQVMDKLDKEAEEALNSDPTKGRGRGPKWLD